MRKKVSTFRYEIDLVSAAGDRSEVVDPWVDTGSLYSQFPASLLERLGYTPTSTRRFKLADGAVMERPIGQVKVRIDSEMLAVVCIFGEEEGESLLGATTLEDFSLAVDPVNETLVPTIAMRLSMMHVNELDQGYRRS